MIGRIPNETAAIGVAPGLPHPVAPVFKGGINTRPADRFVRFGFDGNPQGPVGKLERIRLSEKTDPPPESEEPKKPKDKRGPIRRLLHKGRYVLLSLVLLGGVADAAVMQIQHHQNEQRIQNLEAEIGASFKAVELEDGTILVISSTGEITKTTLGRTAEASGFIRSYTPGMVHWGSGVFLQDAQGDFYFMTNNHVVDGNSEDGTFEINPYRSNTWVKATVVSRTEDPDLAILKVDDPNFVPQQFIKADQVRDLEKEPLIEGEPIFAVGNPNQDRHKIIPGIIHDFDGSLGVQYLAGCDHGASGGPIFDMQGRLIGVEQLVYDTVGRCEGIDSDTIQEWMANEDLPLKKEDS